jgi:hypothetical protein
MRDYGAPHRFTDRVVRLRHGGDRSSAVRACSAIVLLIPSGVSGPVRGRSARRAVIEVPPDAVVWIPDQRHRTSIGAGRRGPVLVLRHRRVRRGGVHGCDFSPDRAATARGGASGRRPAGSARRPVTVRVKGYGQRTRPRSSPAHAVGARRGRGEPASDALLVQASADPGMSHRVWPPTGAGEADRGRWQRWKKAVRQADDGGRPTGPAGNRARAAVAATAGCRGYRWWGGGADRSGTMWRIAGPLGW